jgi:hypothetical protein
MNHPECFVAGLDRVDDDPKSDKVIDTTEAHILPHHLEMNTVKMLGPAGDSSQNAVLIQLGSQGLLEFIDISTALFFGLRKSLEDSFAGFGFEAPE